MIYDPIDKAIQRGGGFTLHPIAMGGPTKFGVPQSVYTAYLGRSASLQDVRDMTEATARDIYERNYYTGPRIDTLPNPPRTIALDIAINHGPKIAIRIVQRVVNAAGCGPITVDGILGPETREAAIRMHTDMGMVSQNAIVDEYVTYCNAQIARDPDKAPIMNGWIDNIAKFRKNITT